MMTHAGRKVGVVASLAINAILLGTIFSVKVRQPEIPIGSGHEVEARKPLTALDQPGKLEPASTVASHATYVDIGGERIILYQELVPMPWPLAMEFLGIRPFLDLDREVTISNKLARGLSLSDAERDSLQNVARELFQEVKAIEKTGAHLEKSADGSQYFVVEPNAAARSGIVERLRRQVVELIGAERGANLMGLLEQHTYFAVEEGSVELAVGKPQEREDLNFLLVRNFASGDSVSENRVLDKYGIQRIDHRWGHVVDLEPWKKFIEENPPAPLPKMELPVSQNIMLDGFGEGISIFD